MRVPAETRRHLVQPMMRATIRREPLCDLVTSLTIMPSGSIRVSTTNGAHVREQGGAPQVQSCGEGACVACATPPIVRQRDAVQYGSHTGWTAGA
jgi:hypothetical protein